MVPADRRFCCKHLEASSEQRRPEVRLDEGQKFMCGYKLCTTLTSVQGEHCARCKVQQSPASAELALAPGTAAAAAPYALEDWQCGVDNCRRPKPCHYHIGQPPALVESAQAPAEKVAQKKAEEDSRYIMLGEKMFSKDISGAEVVKVASNGAVLFKLKCMGMTDNVWLELAEYKLWPLAVAAMAKFEKSSGTAA
jgi:hypothetical protein